METKDARGIVLAGAYQWGEMPFDDLLPRPLVPVAQKPLITYALRWLREGGVSCATICTNSAARAVRACLSNGFSHSLNLDYLEDWMPRGAAGCVRDAGLRSSGETFVIADGTAIPQVDLPSLLETHEASGAALTVVVHNDPDYRAFGQTPLSPSGIYVCDRRVFDFIPGAGFFDIKEGLIPRLHRAGERVVTHTGHGACPRPVNAESYLQLNEWIIESIVRHPGQLEGYELLGEAMVHGSSYVDPRARLVGPVLVGPGVSIHAEATIVGPTTIGDGSSVDEGAVVSRTVVWRDCVIGGGAVVDRCLLADGAVVRSREAVFGSIKTRPRQEGGALASLFSRDRAQGWVPATQRTGHA